MAARNIRTRPSRAAAGTANALLWLLLLKGALVAGALAAVGARQLVPM